MPTEEQQALYNANKRAKRRADKHKAMPETQALLAELNALKMSIEGEKVYMFISDYESGLRERAEHWKSEYEALKKEKARAEARALRAWAPGTRTGAAQPYPMV